MGIGTGRRRDAVAVAVLVACTAGSLAAQRIDVRAASERGPLPGAMVIVEGADGRPVSRVLANAAGIGRVEVPAGRYRVRVLAIGHGPEVSEWLTVDAGSVATVRLTLVPRPLIIDEIVVDGRAVCGRAVAGGAQLARLWDEARKTLDAAQLARAADAARFEVTLFERQLNAADVVLRESRVVRRGRAGQPFVAAAEEIERGGYVQKTGNDQTYYAPDEPLLLSDHFLTTHCFSIAQNGLDPDLVGLRFEPAPRHRLPDIAGVLWLRRQTAELTLLAFSYANVRLPGQARNVGGHIRFERLPTGVSVIADWSIRMPRVVTIDGRWRSRDSLAGYVEVGGITTLDSRPQDLARATLAGRVVDSIAWTGLAGAVVSISDGAYADTTDESGAFRLGAPVQGNFLVTFRHPRLDQLQVSPLHRAALLVRGEETWIDLALPGERSSLDRFCPADAPSDDRSAILGLLLDAAGEPRPGEKVRATWDVLRRAGSRLSVQPVEVTVTTGARGEFAVCAPVGHRVTLRPAEGPGSAVLEGRRDRVSFVTLGVGR